MHPRLRKIKFHNASHVGRLSKDLEPDANARIVGSHPKETQSNKNRMLKSIVVFSMIQAEVWMQSSASGLSFLNPYDMATLHGGERPDVICTVTSLKGCRC